jgi:hypothetical protein
MIPAIRIGKLARRVVYPPGRQLIRWWDFTWKRVQPITI